MKKNKIVALFSLLVTLNCNSQETPTKNESLSGLFHDVIQVPNHKRMTWIEYLGFQGQYTIDISRGKSLHESDFEDGVNSVINLLVDQVNHFTPSESKMYHSRRFVKISGDIKGHATTLDCQVLFNINLESSLFTSETNPFHDDNDPLYISLAKEDPYFQFVHTSCKEGITNCGYINIVTIEGCRLEKFHPSLEASLKEKLEILLLYKNFSVLGKCQDEEILIPGT